jgi:hypothetical protein
VHLTSHHRVAARGAIAFATTLVLMIAPGVASAASLSIDTTTTDVVEQHAFTVSVTGTADTSSRVYAFVEASASGGESCAATAYDEGNRSGSTEVTGMLSYTADGDPVSAGSVGIAHDYTPGVAGSYRLCAYLGNTAYDPPMVAASRLITVRRSTASVTLSSSTPDPAEQTSFAVTASGTTENDRVLFVFVESKTTVTDSCAGTPYDEANRAETTELTGTLSYSADGDAIPAGSFATSDDYTPMTAGSYRVCAYVGRTSYDSPYAAATLLLAPRRAHGSIAVAASGDTVEHRPFSITATGDTEQARGVYVFAAAPSAAADCAADPYTEGSRSGTTEVTGTISYSTDGDVVDAGAFARTHAVTPDTPGVWRLCAYLARNSYETPYAIASTTVSVRRFAAAISIVPADATIGAPVPISVSGTSEEARKLSVFMVSAGSSCAATVDGQKQGLKPVIDGLAVGAGGFSASTSITPRDATPVLVCAYVTAASYDVPNAIASVMIVPHPSAALTATLKPIAGGRIRNLKPTFRWDAGPGSDTLVLYNQEPGAGTTPLAQITSTKSTGDVAGTLKLVSGVWTASLSAALEPGTYWWRVLRVDSTLNLKVYSAVSRLIVEPPPLKTLRVLRRVSTGKLLKKPGLTTLVIKAAPYSRVLFKVRRLARKQTFSLGLHTQKTLKFAWSCTKTGTFSYTVEVSDRYGTKKRATGRWTVPARHCAHLRQVEAAKRAAARRKAAAKRQRQAEQRRRDQQAAQQEDSSSGGSGGSGGSDSEGSVGCDGDPHATPYPQFAGQRDGDGDGCYGET